MIELIFVIVILGILASVAIPRLAATRTDAEISATVANLRTLLSDVASYYAVKGEFGANTKWQDITNVPLLKKDGNPINDYNKATSDAFLAADGEKCIAIRVVNRNGATPAHIIFGKDRKNGVCGEVLKADAVRAFVEARVDGVELGDSIGDGAIAIGSSTTIY
ncbi:type II secretion system protein [Campylobacter sp.]|uniref:type II secretion system protein n=1 Tax=Campylobacter sp. TaxID=205 RepID=UPI0039E9CCDE